MPMTGYRSGPNEAEIHCQIGPQRLQCIGSIADSIGRMVRTRLPKVLYGVVRTEYSYFVLRTCPVSLRYQCWNWAEFMQGARTDPATGRLVCASLAQQAGRPLLQGASPARMAGERVRMG